MLKVTDFLFSQIYRETYEWNEDHIPHAVYTGRGNLERDIEGMVPNVEDEVVLYCAGGFRSLVAADTLKKMGYKNVKSLKGGIGGWKREGKVAIKSKSNCIFLFRQSFYLE